jgi:hypothetical protein
MTQAVAVRRDGDAFQARLFWWYAARLLDPESRLARVGFEHGPKGFDDIWLEYEPGLGPLDQCGQAIEREHIQCKWHSTPGTYGYADLTEPAFINADSRSFLERARDAQVAHAPDGVGVRFELLTNWRVDRTDPLGRMRGTRSGALRLDRLFEGATDKSQSGAVRRAWREHLGIDEQALRLLARVLAFGEATDTLDRLRESLDVLFRCVGLKRVPAHESTFPYDDTVFRWMGQGRLAFDRPQFRDICGREGLLSEAKGRERIYGVKSFEHPIDRLEQRCDAVLNLTAAFDERYIRDAADWQATLYPELRAFLLSAAADGPRVRLVLDVHATLAFAAGSVLNIKSGRQIELEQRTTARRIWSVDDSAADLVWSTLEAEIVEFDPAASDVAVAVGLTHDIARDVQQYLASTGITVGRLLILSPSAGAGATSVSCGAHAFRLADAAVGAIRDVRGRAGCGVTHLFVAGPNAFTFFLGQRLPALGPVLLYEFDFERTRTYLPSLALPLAVDGADSRP